MTATDRRPTLPGELLREDVLPALGLSVSEAAAHLKVSRQMLHRVLSGHAAVTPEMAVRLGKLCGNGPELWLRMQQAVDLRDAEARLSEEVKTIPTLTAA
ncbi:MAG TPA: HigA family addiction module antitoxin [Stellaceae bacterium]|nr:HigA family addiction module antitoxin [Stellaceae bacterium]